MVNIRHGPLEPVEIRFGGFRFLNFRFILINHIQTLLIIDQNLV